jgi:hypothetical protein
MKIKLIGGKIKMERDSAVLFVLNSNNTSVPPGLLTPKILMSLNKCGGCHRMSETFVTIDYESFNLCRECSKKICVKCPNRKSNSLDKLNHICNDCKY